ncbi:MAG: metallophosphoesterase family protein [Limnochordia bacterium]|jgi:predicted phosphodiesterase
MSFDGLLPDIAIRRHRLAPWFLAVLMAIIFVNTLGSIHFQMGALGLEIRAGFFSVSQGRTRLLLPPVGEIEAATHRIPVLLEISLRSIDLSLLEHVGLPLGETTEAVVNRFVSQARGIIVLFLVKIALLAACGGLLGVWLWRPFHSRSLWQGALVGLLVALFFSGLVGFDYDPRAFNNPEYKGMLEAAPWVTGLIQTSIEHVGELGEQLRLITSGLYSLYQRVEDLEPLGIMEADLKVLHVSDIHNNPAAFDLIQQVVVSFGIDFIVDTGDLTDWGTPLEVEIVQRIQGMERPYFFISGNHETPEILGRLGETGNVVLLDGQMVERGGLRIWGIGDEAAGSLSPRSAPLERLQALARQIDGRIDSLGTKPHIVAVHNHHIAEGLTADVPAILYGHNHRLQVGTRGGTMLINAGTTGAEGIRGLQSKEPIPYSLAILYFSHQGGEIELKAVDTLRVDTLPGGFTLERFSPPEHNG